MKLLILIILIVVIWYIYNKSKSINNGKAYLINRQKNENIIYLNENNSRKNVGKFDNGVIYALPQSSGVNPWVVGYYDANGNVYNADNALIGNVKADGRLLLSKEYQYEEVRKTLPNVQLTKRNAELWRSIGESLGGDVGTIFEGNDYERGLAYYETNGKADIVAPMIGAGAAYIALVYEMIIPSDNREFYTWNASQWFEKK